MGQTIGWYKFTTDKSKHTWADDVPEWADMKFDGRWEWFRAILDVPHERTDMSDDAMFRPTDFAAFRGKLNEQGLLEPDEDGDCLIRDITDWLEQHPDVYVEYS
jgi:hypothetical protein